MFYSLSVWDACSESLISFDQANQMDEDSLAYIVENDVVLSCLLERLKQFNVELRLNSKVKQFEYNENSIGIQLQDEKISLRTGLLVKYYFPRFLSINFHLFRLQPTDINPVFEIWHVYRQFNGIMINLV